jgi:hypothetical protein
MGYNKTATNKKERKVVHKNNRNDKKKIIFRINYKKCHELQLKKWAQTN